MARPVTLSVGERHRLLHVGAVICVLNFVDIVVTQRLLDRGHREGNPIMAPFAGSLWGVAIKLTVPALVVLAHLWHPSTLSIVGLEIVAIIYCLVVTWNCHLLVWAT